MAWRHIQKMRWVFFNTTQRFDALYITCIFETYVFKRIVQNPISAYNNTFNSKSCFVWKMACLWNWEKRWRIPNVNSFKAFINRFYSSDHPIFTQKRFGAISSIMMCQSLVFQGMKIKHIMSLKYVVVILNSLLHILHFVLIRQIKSSSN